MQTGSRLRSFPANHSNGYALDEKRQLSRFFAPIEYCSKRKAYYYQDSEYELAYQQLNLTEVNLLENACSIASRHMKPDQRAILGDVLFKIKKKYMAK